MPTLSYQAYSSRKFPPLDAALGRIAAAGFTAIEGYGGLFDDADSLQAGMETHGLSMPSSHIGLDQIEGDPDSVLKLAERFGIHAIYAPFVAPDGRPSTRSEWSDFGARVARAGAPLVDAGLTFGWHNHEFELADLGGVTPLELMLEAAPDLTLELDLGWVARGGADCVSWLQKHGSRISAVHIKDLAPAGTHEDEDGWADVGHGTMNWIDIFEAIKGSAVSILVAEHDNPSDDGRFARRSYETAEKLLEAL